MSFYNQLMGGYSNSLQIAAMLFRFTEPQDFQRLFPRFRDTHVVPVDGEPRMFTVTVMTRTGGPNREKWAVPIEMWRQHHEYQSDTDCPHDPSFMYFVFRCEAYSWLTNQMRSFLESDAMKDEALPMDRFVALNKLMESDPDDPRAVAALKRAAGIMQPLIDAIKDIPSDDAKKGEVKVITVDQVDIDDGKLLN